MISMGRAEMENMERMMPAHLLVRRRNNTQLDKISQVRAQMEYMELMMSAQVE
jgi:hypothetical protein